MTARPADPHIGLVVEGAGDKNALPLLLRAHLSAVGEFRDVLGKPIPFHGKTKATAPGGIEGYCGTAAARPGCVGTIVLLDSDDAEACIQGPGLTERANKVSRVPVHVCLAERDFEDWLAASIETLDLGASAYDPRGRGLTILEGLIRPDKYVKPVWQPRLAARVDVDLVARRSTSFARLLRKVDLLAERLPTGS